MNQNNRHGKGGGIVALLVAILLALWQQYSGVQLGTESNTTAGGSSASSADTARNGSSNFDYYVLSLSWSPEHCATSDRPDNQQCGVQRRYGFIVHGLWPQNQHGYPHDCAGDPRLSQSIVESMRDIMPSDTLIHHEWAKHGLCSGLDASAYFQQVRNARTRIVIPASFSPDSVRVNSSEEAIRKDFLAANPSLGRDTLALQCDSQYLAEVRICMDKSLQPRQCGNDVRSFCRGERVIVRPVR